MRRHPRAHLSRKKQEHGFAAMGAAIVVAGVVTTGVYMMSQSSNNSLKAREEIELQSSELDSSLAALRRLTQFVASGKIGISMAPGSVQNFIGDAKLFVPIAEGGTGFTRHADKKNMIFLKTCGETQMAVGESYDLPNGLASTVACAEAKQLTTAIEITEINEVTKSADPKNDGFYARARLKTGRGLNGSEKGGIVVQFKIPSPEDGGNDAVSDLCPYKDPSLNTKTSQYSNDFFLGGGRYHAGWIKLGLKKTYKSQQIGAAGGFVGVSNWNSIPSNRGGHGWEWVTPSNATHIIENYEFAVDNGSGGTWYHMSKLMIPRDEPGKCYWWVGCRRQPGFGAGCFVAGTKIRMADGSEKAVEQVTAGEMVLNPVTGGSAVVDRVTVGPEDKPLMRVFIGGKSVDVSSEHAFVTPTGPKRADQLRSGDEVIAEKGRVRVVEKIESLTPEKRPLVYNFALASEDGEQLAHAVMADGVVTGDLYLQEQLARQAGTLASEPPPSAEVVKQLIDEMYGVDKLKKGKHASR